MVLKKDMSINLIPQPQDSQRAGTDVQLSPNCVIISRQHDSLPAARLLQEKLTQLTGWPFDLREEPAADVNAIELDLNTDLNADAYQITAEGNQIILDGGSLAGLISGTASICQIAGYATDSNPITDQQSTGNPMNLKSLAFPGLHIRDWPSSVYRGLMLDLARSWHDIHLLKKIIILCYWYKINYLHLHLTDNGPYFTFPTEKYSRALTPGFFYSRKQLQDLEQFAAAHGVTLIPELDLPGHAQQLLEAYPQLGDRRTVDYLPTQTPAQVLCVGNPETRQAVATLIDELCQTFPLSPYLHIGGDEVDRQDWSVCPVCRQYCLDHNMASTEELYREFIVWANEIVQARGKQMIVWEGFSREGKTAIPKDIVVMAYESQFHMPQDLVAAGYPVINASWKPLYIAADYHWPAIDIYHWNPNRWESCWEASGAYPEAIQLPRNNQVIGAEMCSWENAADTVFEKIRKRLAAFGERLWQPNIDLPYVDFLHRFNDQSAELDILLSNID